MDSPNDHGMFPQSLLRFLAACSNLGVGELEALRMYLATFRLPAKHEDALWRIEERLVAGSTLADQFEAHPELFGRWISSTVRWGQKTGDLAGALDRAARLADLDQRIGRSVSTALVYPAVLITLGLVILGFHLMFVAPQFAHIGRGLGVYDTSRLCTFDVEWPILASAAGLVRGLVDGALPVLVVVWIAWFTLLCAWMIGSIPGHSLLSRLAESIVPRGRRVRREARCALQARLMSEGLGASMGLDDALENVADLCTDSRIEWQLRATARAVRAGSPPGLSFEAAGSWPDEYRLLGLALASPDPRASLREVSETLEAKARDELGFLGRAAVPILTVCIAAVIFIVPAWTFVELTRFLSTTSNLLF